MALLTKEEGIVQYPLFINYGQLSKDKEMKTCLINFERYQLPTPKIIQLSGYGELLSSGLTDPEKRIFEDAFLPCRNLMFLTIGAAYAHQTNSNAVSIGLLDEAFGLFPDQTKSFIRDTELLVSKALGRSINVLTPLMSFTKADVVNLAREKQISGTYSCHAGTDIPCGVCVACREYIGLEV